MNITTQLFKLSSLFLLTLLCACGVQCVNNPNVDQADYNNRITTFFSQSLSGGDIDFEAEKVIKLSDIKKQQELVWELWKQANNDKDEEKLIPLEKLDNGKSGRWNLPQNLEPNAIMPYYWGSKGVAKPANGYPLYMYTHGSGSKDSEWKTGLSLCKSFDDAPSVYFIPQIPNMGKYYRWWQKSKQFAWEKMLRLAFLSGEIDPNKVYFFGISEGGYGSQRLASFYADYLAGAGPMAGGEPLKNAPAENCKNMAFSLLTGELDNMFYRSKLTGYTKDEFERIKELYPNYFIHRIELIPRMGHSIDYRLATPWLKQYTRDPYPKSVFWENFEMDDLYRKGFYNIVVKERSNDNFDSRTYYKMDIKGNEISFNVDLVTYETIETDPQWGIELKFNRTYQPAAKGRFIVYLCEELLDLDKTITLTVNGKQAFKGKVKPDLKNIVNSCAVFYDPARLYPAAIEVDLAKL